MSEAMRMRPALRLARRGEIRPFMAMEVLREAGRREALGERVLHLEVGQPATAAPAGALAAVQAALAAGPLGYTDAAGIPALRQRIARHYAETYGVEVSPERILVTTGSSGGFVLSFMAAFDAGDRVALALPCYPAYRNILGALNLVPVELPVGPETRYQPTRAVLEALDRDPAGPPAGLIIASPSNPTGTLLHADELADVVAWCDERAVTLISDEIYHGITFGAKAATALAYSDRPVVVNSFSKYYSMTGWRIGWMVLPEALIRNTERLAQNLTVCPPAISQHAALAAMDCREELETNVARYARNLQVLRDGFRRAGLTGLSATEGAFYLYVDIGEVTNDSEAFCARLLAETGIAVTPGLDFDPGRGHRTMRLSFCGWTETMEAAMDRFLPWLGRG